MARISTTLFCDDARLGIELKRFEVTIGFQPRCSHPVQLQTILHLHRLEFVRSVVKYLHEGDAHSFLTSTFPGLSIDDCISLVRQTIMLC
jgi:hypothetical protein